MKLKPLIKAGLKFVDNNLPMILTIVGELGLIATTASAIHDAPKGIEAIDGAKLEKAEKIEREKPETLEQYKGDNGEYLLKKIKLTPWEYFKCLTPVYWKTGVSFAITGSCIFFANHVEHKRYLAVLGALALKEKDLQQTKDKIVEFFGEKKAKEFEKKLDEDIVAKAPNDGVIYYTGHGDYLCYEPLTRSYFRSSIEAVKSGINDFLRQLISDGTASVSDLACCLDIPIEDTYLEDRSGWSYEGNKSELPTFSYDYVGHPVTQEPCLMIKCDDKPISGLY